MFPFPIKFRDIWILSKRLLSLLKFDQLIIKIDPAATWMDWAKLETEELGPEEHNHKLNSEEIQSLLYRQSARIVVRKW